MRLLLPIIIALLSLVVIPAHAADGPIDWSETGFSALRECAHPIFNGCCGQQAISRSMGCSTKSCLCRHDLIVDVQKLIKDSVSSRCNKQVDVDAALKVYNDYCASNGFPIPGYTYISTQTVRVSTVTATPAVNTPTTTIIDGTGGSNGGGGGLGGAATTTIGIITATATVYRSSSAASQLKPLPAGTTTTYLFTMLVFFLASLMLAKTARAQTVVVTHTEPAPPPAFSSVVTTRQTFVTQPIVSIQRVTLTEEDSGTTLTITKTQNSLVGGSRTSTTNGNENRNVGEEGSGANGKGGLSPLETASMIISIILGVPTTVVTIWMFIRKRKS